MRSLSAYSSEGAGWTQSSYLLLCLPRNCGGKFSSSGSGAETREHRPISSKSRNQEYASLHVPFRKLAEDLYAKWWNREAHMIQKDISNIRHEKFQWKSDWPAGKECRSARLGGWNGHPPKHLIKEGNGPIPNSKCRTHLSPSRTEAIGHLHQESWVRLDFRFTSHLVITSYSHFVMIVVI